MKKKRYKLKWKRIIVAIIILITFILTILQITSYFSKKQTNVEQNIEIGINYHTEQKNAKNAVKTQNSMRRDFCGLHVVICEHEQYDEITYKIKKTAEQYGIDWKLAVAIARHETGHYTSAVFKNLNNVGGNFGIRDGEYQLLKFETLEDGIEYFINNLKVKYIDLGLTSISDIQKKYAPLNVENDPTNLNQYWTSSVKKIYESLE